jgi:hypothetical protein
VRKEDLARGGKQTSIDVIEILGRPTVERLHLQNISRRSDCNLDGLSPKSCTLTNPTAYPTYSLRELIRD